MFIATHSNPKDFLKFFKSFHDIVEISNILISENGMLINGFDSLKTSIVDSNISSKIFSSFNYTFPDESVLISIYTSTFSSLDNSVTKDDKMILEIDESLETLNITLENNTRKTKFLLKLVSLDEDIQEFDMKYTIKLKMPISNFISACDDIKTVKSEKVTFKIRDSRIIIVGNGELGKTKSEWKFKHDKIDFDSEDISTKRIKLENIDDNESSSPTSKLVNKQNVKSVDDKGTKNDNKIKIKIKMPSKKITKKRKKPDNINKIVKFDANSNFAITFGISLIEKILKISSICSLVEFSLAADLPLKLHFAFDEDESSYLDYYIAPKVN